MDVTLITGFLGAGKTTTLKRILREHGDREKMGVIVNDLSDLEVDGELVRLGEAVSEKDGTLASVNSGSISDRKRGEFTEALREMEKRGLRHILVETSGGSHPVSVIHDIQATPGVTLRSVVSLVDARALLHDFGGGPDLVRQIVANEESGDVTVENLLVSQLRAASVIALTKVDLIPSTELEVLLRTLQILNPRATLTACVFGKLDAKLLFDSPPYDTARHDLVDDGLSETEDYDIGNTIIRDARPFHPQRLYEHYQQRLGLGIFRSKGFIWLASRPDDVLLWNQAGGTMGLELLGTWRAAAVSHGNLLAEEQEAMKLKLKDTHPIFGDRGNELTIIGREYDREIFCAGLQECFCTPTEITAWKKGAEFADPFPKNIRTLD